MEDETETYDDAANEDEDEDEDEPYAPSWNDKTAELLERVVTWFYDHEYTGDPVVRKLISELDATIDGLT